MPQNPDIQEDFNRLYCDAASIDSENLRRTGQSGGERFIRSYIYERLVQKYPDLQPEAFARMEECFHLNWAPGYGGWERIVRAKTGMTDNGNGTVTDERTGLMWQKTDPVGKMKWNAAVEYAASLALAGYSDWRLPTKEELISLSRSLGEFGRERESYEPNAPNARASEARKRFFPSMKCSEYWVSDEYPNNNTDAYYVDFSEGIYLGTSETAYKTSEFGVRCVRKSEKGKQ